MDPRLLRHYESELRFLRDMGARVRRRVPQDRRPARPGEHRGRRSLCRAAARGLRLPDRAHPAEDGGGIPDLHAVAAADGLSALSGARRRRWRWCGSRPDAGACAARRRASPCRPARSCAACSAPRTRPTANSAPATPSSCCRSNWPRPTTSPRPPRSPPSACPSSANVKAAIRLRLRTTGELPVDKLALERLSFFLGGPEGARMRLYEQLIANVAAIYVRPDRAPAALAGTAAAHRAARRRLRAGGGAAAARAGSRSTATGCCRNTTPCRSGSCSSTSAGLDRAVRALRRPASWKSCSCSTAASRRWRRLRRRTTCSCSARRRSTCFPSAATASTCRSARPST